MPISVTKDQKFPIPTKLLRQAGLRVLREAGLENALVDILLTDDSTVRSLNLQYRGLDKTTDVLSFAQMDAAAGGPDVPKSPLLPIILGDVVISVPTALQQANQHAVSIEQELALLTVHGILHLLGFEDETDAGALSMHTREKQLLGFTFSAAEIS